MAKKITLEQLARVVQGGFKEVDTKVDRVDAKVEDLKKARSRSSAPRQALNFNH